jgi:hypothetical protein
LIAALVCSGSSGQAVIIRSISGYFCKVLSKLVDKTGLLFSVSRLFAGAFELSLRGSNPLGAIFRLMSRQVI